MNLPYYSDKPKQSLSLDIGAIVRFYMSMDKPTYSENNEAALEIVVNQLGVVYDINHDSDKLHAYIHRRAADAYKRFKNYCKDLYKEQKSNRPVPEEFDTRPDEWDFLCAHFETPKFKLKS
jgi:hypothetical protein